MNRSRCPPLATEPGMPGSPGPIDNAGYCTEADRIADPAARP